MMWTRASRGSWLLVLVITVSSGRVSAQDTLPADLDTRLYEDDIIDAARLRNLQDFAPDLADAFPEGLLQKMLLAANWETPTLSDDGSESLLDYPNTALFLLPQKRIPGFLHQTDTSAKKLAKELEARLKKITVQKLQPRWKIKKGKIGPRRKILCFFKLCALRTPVET